MSLRKQARILGISHTYLSLLLTGKWKWSADLKERYEELVTTFVTTQEMEHKIGGKKIRLPHAYAQHDGGRYKGRTCDLCDVNGKTA